jgi:hypothetical protein
MQRTTELQMRKSADGLLAEGLLIGLWVGDLLVSAEYWLLRGGTFALPALRALVTHPLRLALTAGVLLTAGSLRMGCFERVDEARATICARLDERAIVSAAELYKIETGRWPACLEDLAPRYLRELRTDPWGRNYSLYRGEGGFAVVSAGPDGENGTHDDVITISPRRKE